MSEHFYLLPLSILKFEQISHIVLVFPQLTLNKQMPAGLQTNVHDVCMLMQKNVLRIC